MSTAAGQLALAEAGICLKALRWIFHGSKDVIVSCLMLWPAPAPATRQSCESPRPCSVSVRGAAARTLLLRGKFPRQQLPCFLTGRLMEQGRGKGQSAEYGFIGLGASTHSVSHRHRFPRADVEPGALPAQAPGPAPRLGAHRARSPHAEPAGCSCCKIKTNLD